jgi:uncharacterized membrane protein YkgB
MKNLTTSITAFSQRNYLIAAGLGLVYFWFGMRMTFGLINPALGLPLLAIWECTIGLLLLTGVCRKCALSVALVHIVLTFTPLFIFPELCFNDVPFGLTLVGQYIVKNVVLFGAMLALLKSGTPEIKD